jgi:adenylate cyclase
VTAPVTRQARDTSARATGRPPWRIRYRVGLGVAVSLLVTAAVGAVAWPTFLETRASITELTHERIRELLSGTAARVESHLLQAVPAIEVSRMLLRESLVPSDRDALARQFVVVLRANPSFSWMSYSDQEGSFTGAYRTLAGRLHVSQSTTRDGAGELREHVVAEDGAWVPSLRQAGYAYDPRAEPFFVAARDARQRVWVGPYVFYDEGVPGVTCAAPHLAPDGRLLGVFTVDFNLNFLSQFVAGLAFGDHGRVFLLTRDDVVVAHPTLRVVEHHGQGAKGRLVTAAADPLLQALVGAARRDGGWARPAAGGAADRELAFEHAGQRYLAGYRTLEIDRGLSWVLAAVAPEADFMDVLARNRLTAALVAGAALVLSALVALWLARRISVPLARLASEMGDVGSFRLTPRPPARTIFTEVALMDESLLRMKGSLRSFAYYVPTDLVRALLASGQEATLQGETRELTVYFSDIADFTTMAEAMSPDELVRHLSGYFDEMTGIVAAHGGTVDKFIGDAIMAFWGAPVASPDHAARACEAAIRCQRRLAELRSAAGGSGPAAIHSRIGIATGEALVGNIGSRARFNYTVMGDTVNLASRLEGLGKVYGTAMLVSEATYRAAAGRVIGRPVDVVRVKGKRRGVRVYELLGLATDDDAEARQLAALAEAGLEAYLGRRFEAAAACFEQALGLRPRDRAAALLLERSRLFLGAPPPAEWDGVHVMTEK